MSTACVETTSWRSLHAALTTGATSGPVPPTNIVANPPKTPQPKNFNGPGLELLNFGAHVAYRTNKPRIACKTQISIAKSALPPIKDPTNVPTAKAGITEYKISRRIRSARKPFEPIWTTAWIGIKTVGGKNNVIAARLRRPPPSPNEAAIRLPTNETPHKIEKPKIVRFVPSTRNPMTLSNATSLLIILYLPHCP